MSTTAAKRPRVDPPTREIFCSTLSSTLAPTGIQQRFYLHDVWDAGGASPPAASSDLLPTRCFQCDKELAPGEGVPLVKRYDRARNEYLKWGEFCWFSCAKRWALEHPSYCTPQQLLLLDKYAEERHGVREPVHPAPPTICQARYHGPMSPEEYRASGGPARPCLVHEPPSVSLAMVIECRSAAPTAAASKSPSTENTLERRAMGKAWNLRGLRLTGVTPASAPAADAPPKEAAAARESPFDKFVAAQKTAIPAAPSPAAPQPAPLPSARPSLASILKRRRDSQTEAK